MILAIPKQEVGSKITQSSESLLTHVVAITVKTSGWGINSYCIWKPGFVVQTIIFSSCVKLF